jgi:hypothetical protein
MCLLFARAQWNEIFGPPISYFIALLSTNSRQGAGKAAALSAISDPLAFDSTKLCYRVGISHAVVFRHFGTRVPFVILHQTHSHHHSLDSIGRHLGHIRHQTKPPRRGNH